MSLKTLPEVQVNSIMVEAKDANDIEKEFCLEISQDKLVELQKADVYCRHISQLLSSGEDGTTKSILLR